MKTIRVFSSEEIRDAVLDAADYSILYMTEGAGVGLKAVVQGPDYSEPFYVENITNETETLTISVYDYDETGLDINIPVEYSTDRINWNPLGTTALGNRLTKTLEPGDKIYLRATTDAWSKPNPHSDYMTYGNNIYGVSKVGGNIMSLLYGNNFTGNERSFPNNSASIFYMLFCDFSSYENINLIDASKLILPATTLADGCYSNMFYGCNLLTAVPELPATTLSPSCYYNMFCLCSSLTQAPELPATTLADRCYEGMFSDCVSLTQAPELPATTLAESCYSNMFNRCTLLTHAPELPATTLAESCYYSMFIFCPNLNYIKCLATDISASSCLHDWTNFVSSTGTFIKAAGVAYPTGTSGIPSGWTVEEI